MADKKTILFVDDNNVDRTLISRLLEKHDFNVLLAEDGAGGLHMAQGQALDLILLDILLPGISGIELCKRFKGNPTTKDVPVVFYTSIDVPKEFIDYASCGASDYIQKNISPQELIATIKALLKK